MKPEYYSLPLSLDTVLLKQDILIIENLCNLEQVPPSGFRFFGVPIKAVGAAAMTIRAFAEVA